MSSGSPHYQSAILVLGGAALVSTLPTGRLLRRSLVLASPGTSRYRLRGCTGQSGTPCRTCAGWFRGRPARRRNLVCTLESGTASGTGVGYLARTHRVSLPAVPLMRLLA